eukprot:1520550-Prymnesium_polylepis.2
MLVATCGMRDQCRCRWGENRTVYGVLGVWVLAAFPYRLTPVHFFVLVLFTIGLHTFACAVNLATTPTVCLVDAACDVALAMLMLVGMRRAELMRRKGFKQRWELAVEIESNRGQLERLRIERRRLRSIDTAFDLIG